MNHKKKGFSLIELIAVIAILGIIASVIVPKVGNHTKNAKKAMFLSDARTIISAVELYNAENSNTIDNDYKLEGENSIKDLLMPEEEDNRYLNTWPEEFPKGVATLGQLKAFVENPDTSSYY